MITNNINSQTIVILALQHLHFRKRKPIVQMGYTRLEKHDCHRFRYFISLGSMRPYCIALAIRALDLFRASFILPVLTKGVSRHKAQGEMEIQP